MNEILTYYVNDKPNVFNQTLDIQYSDGRISTLYLNRYSGKAFYRFKVNSLTKIKHPGIYLGVDDNGFVYYAHNHYEYGNPVIVSEENFRQGQEIFPYPEFATNHPLTVIRKAMDGIINGEKYTPLYFNCQDYVNEAISNQRRSPAVENSFKGLLVLGLLALLGVGLSSDL